MKFFTTSSLLLGLSAVATTVTAVAAAGPAAGKYYIVNRVLSPAGDKLAITFNGQGNTATVPPLANASNQTWTLTNYNANTQYISPTSATNLQASWGGNAVKVVPAGAYTWKISSTETGYIIQDGGATVFWGVSKGAAGDEVAIGGGTGSEKQSWIFTPAA